MAVRATTRTIPLSHPSHAPDGRPTTLLALILVFSLSMKLRQREMTTVFKMGSSRNLISRLFLAEILIILGVSALLNLSLLGITRYLANNYEQLILVFL